VEREFSQEVLENTQI